MEILPEVPETLADLAQRHRLFLVTKGNVTEQTGKFERSGLKEHFTAIEVLAEKDADTYQRRGRKIWLACARLRG